MRLTRGLKVLLTLIVLGTGAWLGFQRYWYYLPGIIGVLRDPIGPARAVDWRPGPATPPVAGARPPNVLVILADDLGWNDLTFNGGGVAGGSVPTPRIDSIGRDGVIFSRAYAGNATCAPSRAAIMTGRYATRFGFEFTPAPIAFSKLIGSFPTGTGQPMRYHAERERDIPGSIDELTVPTSEIMIGQIMKAKGYHTLMLGKWHLGGTPATRPEARGFDEALAFYDGAAMFLPERDARVVNSKQDFDPIDKFLWANLPFAIRYNGQKRFAPDDYMTDYLGREAARAISANKNQPFFMYLAYNAPHTPLQALRSDYDALAHIKDHRLRVYAAMIRALDRSVGVVLDALKANGLEDDTLVIFTSDNGGAGYIGLPDINQPFRGWKATFFEGGLHVPFFMRWPARLPKARVYDKPVAHVDIFATAAGVSGADLPGDRVLDGADLVKAATGATAGDPHKSLYWRSGGYRVLLAGGWKLQVMDDPRKTWLFDLSTDPTERSNLALSRPDKLAELRAELARVDAEQIQPRWPSLLEAPVMIDTATSFPVAPGAEFIYWGN